MFNLFQWHLSLIMGNESSHGLTGLGILLKMITREFHESTFERGLGKTEGRKWALGDKQHQAGNFTRFRPKDTKGKKPTLSLQSQSHAGRTKYPEVVVKVGQYQGCARSGLKGAWAETQKICCNLFLLLLLSAFGVSSHCPKYNQKQRARNLRVTPCRPQLSGGQSKVEDDWGSYIEKNQQKCQIKLSF